MNARLSLLCVLAALFLSPACSDSDDEPDLPHDQEGILQYGEFNQEAADELRAHQLGPLLWLGEEFEGFRLAHVDIRGITFPSGSGDMTTLIYGDCDGVKANPREPSCTPPLQIQIKPAGAMPPVETLKPSPPQPPAAYTIDERRGLMVYEQSWNIVVEFENGQTASILNQVGNNDGLVNALRSANHEALGVPAVGAEEPLDQFTSLPE